MARVELDQVNKIYRSRGEVVHAVKDFSLTVEDGAFIALLGPSGCGKTSTLRMIVGLEEISAGEIRFDSEVVNHLSPEGRNVAMAFETYALYPNFTVAENLSFPLEVKGIDAAKRESEIARIAKLLQIEPILSQRPGELSGGQQQRVSLGRALIREPAAFILDEVMSHLDAHLKFQMLFELKRVHQSIGKTTIYVTHDQMEALALADKVAVMTEGVLQQYGTRDDLYNRPANRFVADFIGEPPTNFMTADVIANGDKLHLRAEASDLVFQMDDDRERAVRERRIDKVLIGIRPQNLRPANGETGNDLERIDAELLINEYLGEQSILTFAHGDAPLRALAPPDAAYRRGERIALSYHRSDVMLFDPTSEMFIG
ncbi:MAG: ABC transporter ATP-binding protein [Pseudomonadota bacterium]